MIAYTILADERIVIIEPSGPIRQTDLEALTKDIDDYISQNGLIQGLIIHTEAFPRWSDFGAFIKDMKFVLVHHNKIKRVASVTDSRLFMIAHSMLRHLLSPEIKHFYYKDMEAAKKWIQEAR